MQTIIYQGQEVQAARVNYLSGAIPTSTVDLDGDENLLRGADGCYYLRRTLRWLDDECSQRASGHAHPSPQRQRRHLVGDHAPEQ